MIPSHFKSQYSVFLLKMKPKHEEPKPWKGRLTVLNWNVFFCSFSYLEWYVLNALFIFGVHYTDLKPLKLVLYVTTCNSRLWLVLRAPICLTWWAITGMSNYRYAITTYTISRALNLPYITVTKTNLTYGNHLLPFRSKGVRVITPWIVLLWVPMLLPTPSI